MTSKPGKVAKAETALQREKRLKAALQANIAKRKEQAKARDNK